MTPPVPLTRVQQVLAYVLAGMILVTFMVALVVLVVLLLAVVGFFTGWW